MQARSRGRSSAGGQEPQNEAIKRAGRAGGVTASRALVVMFATHGERCRHLCRKSNHILCLSVSWKPPPKQPAADLNHNTALTPAHRNMETDIYGLNLV